MRAPIKKFVQEVQANHTTGLTKEPVHHNKTQYFAGVSDTAWDFYIGGYQPARKWLKDRRGRTLDYEDITHYRRICHVLEQTSELMQKIDGEKN